MLAVFRKVQNRDEIVLLIFKPILKHNEAKFDTKMTAELYITRMTTYLTLTAPPGLKIQL